MFDSDEHTIKNKILEELSETSFLLDMMKQKERERENKK